MESLVAFNLNMEREVETKDFLLVGAVAAAAAVTVIGKYGAEQLIAKLKERQARKLADPMGDQAAIDKQAKKTANS